MRTPRAADEMDWNDWLIAMLALGKLYGDYNHYNLARQITNLTHGVLVGSATYTRASLMAACEVLRRDSICRIMLKQIIDLPRFKRRKYYNSSPKSELEF
jgi:hypothetical protein